MKRALKVDGSIWIKPINRTYERGLRKCRSPRLPQRLIPEGNLGGGKRSNLRWMFQTCQSISVSLVAASFFAIRMPESSAECSGTRAGTINLELLSPHFAKKKCQAAFNKDESHGLIFGDRFKSIYIFLSLQVSSPRSVFRSIGMHSTPVSRQRNCENASSFARSSSGYASSWEPFPNINGFLFLPSMHSGKMLHVIPYFRNHLSHLSPS